jgi:TonB family protein
MNAAFFKSRDAASPWMVLLSVCLHAAGIIAIVAVSFSITTPTKPRETRVTLVQVPIGPPVVEKIETGPAELPPDLPAPEVVEAPPLSAEDAEVSRDTVEQTKLTTLKSEPVQLTKRKKPLQRMAAEKPPEKPKEPLTKKEPPPKKEDDKAYMEKKMAALEEKVKNRRAESRSAAPRNETKPDGKGGQQGEAGADEESARWFNAVRRQVQSHWSLMADPRQIEGLKVKIGVNIANNGEVRGVSVDGSSGDQMFDNSAMRAVYQAAPFPPLPPQVNAEITRKGGLALNFTPRGIQ